MGEKESNYKKIMSRSKIIYLNGSKGSRQGEIFYSEQAAEVAVRSGM